MKFLITLLLCGFAFAIQSINADAANPLTCPAGESSFGGLSNDPFWAGVDGGQLVEQLTNANHDTFIQANNRSLVMYYSPTCPHCKNSKQAFAGAAKKLNTGSVKIIAAVDCRSSSGSSTCSKRKIGGYPTFLLYKKGGVLVGQYSGQRTTDGFVKFVQQN